MELSGSTASPFTPSLWPADALGDSTTGYRVSLRVVPRVCDSAARNGYPKLGRSGSGGGLGRGATAWPPDRGELTIADPLASLLSGHGDSWSLGMGSPGSARTSMRSSIAGCVVGSSSRGQRSCVDRLAERAVSTSRHHANARPAGSRGWEMSKTAAQARMRRVRTLTRWGQFPRMPSRRSHQCRSHYPPVGMQAPHSTPSAKGISRDRGAQEPWNMAAEVGTSDVADRRGPLISRSVLWARYAVAALQRGSLALAAAGGCLFLRVSLAVGCGAAQGRCGAKVEVHLYLQASCSCRNFIWTSIKMPNISRC